MLKKVNNKLTVNGKEVKNKKLIKKINALVAKAKKEAQSTLKQITKFLKKLLK